VLTIDTGIASEIYVKTKEPTLDGDAEQCECNRSNEPDVSQGIGDTDHALNSKQEHRKRQLDIVIPAFVLLNKLFQIERHVALLQIAAAAQLLGNIA
jgi:hypothetical protein